MLSVTSAQMITAEMVAYEPGIWLYYSHISDHMLAGTGRRHELTEK